LICTTLIATIGVSPCSGWGSPCGAKHVGAGKSQVHDVVSTPEPVPTAQERAPNVGVRPSGRNVLLCDGLSDGVDC
jgi:hypothetical protein